MNSIVALDKPKGISMLLNKLNQTNIHGKYR